MKGQSSAGGLGAREEGKGQFFFWQDRNQNARVAGANRGSGGPSCGYDGAN